MQVSSEYILKISFHIEVLIVYRGDYTYAWTTPEDGPRREAFARPSIITSEWTLPLRFTNPGDNLLSLGPEC